MDTLIGKICPFCQETIKEGDSVIVCPSCNIPHHENCWYTHGGCTTPDCLYQPQNTPAQTQQEGFDLSDQLDDMDFAPELPDEKEQPSFDEEKSSKKLIPTVLDPNFPSNDDSDSPNRPKGLNRSIYIMSFLEDHVEEDEMEYSKQREEKIKLGKESLKVMNFTDENAVNNAKAENAAPQKSPSLTKPQQSQHKASLTKPKQSVQNTKQNPSLQKQNQNQNTNTNANTSVSGTKANLSKSQPPQQTKASLTKPDAKAKQQQPQKPSLQKPADSKPTLSKGDKPNPNKRIQNNSPANGNKKSPAININEASVMLPANKANRMNSPDKFEVICVKCKKLIASDQQFCPYCGAVQKEKEKPQFQRKVACPNCGGLVRADQVFCPRCGKKIEEHLTMRETSPTELVPTEEVDTSVSAAVTQLSDTLEKNRRKRKKQLIFTGVATAVLVIAVIFTMKATEKHNFSDMFSDVAKNEWCSISDDGMSMSIDTNPEDKPDAIETMAYSQLKEINKTLGFTENIYRSMGSTRAVDGERYATFRNYKVTWSYNPDTGLEVKYTMQ